MSRTLPAIATVAEQAIKEKQSHLSYLEVLLGMEVEERERNTVARRIKDAHFPKVKTLEAFAFSDAPHIPVAVVRKGSFREDSNDWYRSG